MKASQDNLTSDITQIKSDKKIDSYMNEMRTILTQMMNQKHNYLPYQKALPKTQNPTNIVPVKSKALPLEVGNFTKNGGMWTLKCEISSPKCYELLMKT